MAETAPRQIELAYERKGVLIQNTTDGQKRRPRRTTRGYPADTAMLLGLGTAVPERRMKQEALFQGILAPFLDSNRYAAAIFRHAGVGYRHLVVDETYYSRERTTQARNARYLKEALILGEEAIRHCLSQSNLTPKMVDNSRKNLLSSFKIGRSPLHRG